MDPVSHGSHTNSSKGISRWRRDEVYRRKTKKVHWSPEVRDNHRKTPEVKSTAIGSSKKRDSISFRSGGSYNSQRRSILESPSKLQKINETSEARFLTAEEVINRAFIEVVGPTESSSLSSPKGSKIVGNSHSPEAATSAKSASSLAPKSKKSISFDQHEGSWRSKSSEYEEAAPGFTVKKSDVEGKLTPEKAVKNPRKQVFSDGQDGRESTRNFSGTSYDSGLACVLEHAEPVFRKRGFQEKEFAGNEDLISGMDTGQDDGGIDVALPKKVGEACETQESSGTDALMPETSDGSDTLMPQKSDGPDTSTKLISNPAGVKFEVWSSSNCNDGQERNLQRNLLKSQRAPENVPAIKVIWAGNIDVHENSKFIRCEGILAHPSAKVSRRAYDLSKQISGAVILFDIHPRHHFWPSSFQTSCPGRNDIALYFYPRRNEKSKRQYSTLLKHMIKDDLALRTLIGNVQLLVYPSKLLPPEFQLLDNNYFMWGVFCGPKVAFKGSSLPSPSSTGVA